MEQKVAAIESNITELGKEIKEIKDLIAAGYKSANNNFESLNKELAILHKKIDSLKGDTGKGFDSVGVQLETLTNEISKIDSVTRYGEEFKNSDFINK